MISIAPISSLPISATIGGGAGETGEPLPSPEIEADFEWPFDDLKPRDIGIYPCFANIGGGVSLTGKEPVTTSQGGYWRR